MREQWSCSWGQICYQNRFAIWKNLTLFIFDFEKHRFPGLFWPKTLFSRFLAIKRYISRFFQDSGHPALTLCSVKHIVTKLNFNKHLVYDHGFNISAHADLCVMKKLFNKAIMRIHGKSPVRDLKNANLATLTFKSGNPIHLALFKTAPLDHSYPKTWV